MRVTKLGFVLGVAVLGQLGCGLETGKGAAGRRPPDPVQPGVNCAALEQQARNCGLFGPGTLECDEPEDQREACMFSCFLGASCGDMRQWICSERVNDELPPGALADCVSGCFEQPFQCDSGEPVSASAECDGFVECSDGSDEQRCGGSTFVCAGGAEISEFGVCDGFRECPAGDDEDGCFVECDGGSLVIFKDSLCDGFQDCSDGTDELGCPQEAEPICN